MSWVFKYRLNGKQDKLVIGHYPDLMLKELRRQNYPRRLWNRLRRRLHLRPCHLRPGQLRVAVADCGVY